MKTLKIFAPIIVVFGIALAFVEYYQYKGILELKHKQEILAKDVLRLKQELAERRDGDHSHNAESWPRFHDATGVLLYKTEERVVVDEDEIPGVMRAMIMSYQVEKPEQLQGLREGDKIKLRLKETEDSLTVAEIGKE